MGEKKLAHDFNWVATSEPHASRRKAILTAHGAEVRQLYGYDRSTAVQVRETGGQMAGWGRGTGHGARTNRRWGSERRGSAVRGAAAKRLRCQPGQLGPGWLGWACFQPVCRKHAGCVLGRGESTRWRRAGGACSHETAAIREAVETRPLPRVCAAPTHTHTQSRAFRASAVVVMPALREGGGG